MLTIKKYKAEDGAEMIRRAWMQRYPEGYAENCEISGEGFSFFWKGELLGCAGVHDYTPGIGEAWAMYPADIGSYHIDPQIARNRMNEIIEKRGYRRVRATCRRDFPAGMSYLRYLGFVVEGIMRNYEIDGQDAFLYGKASLYKDYNRNSVLSLSKS